MNKTLKIAYKCAMGLNVLAGLISLISQNYVLGLTQLNVALFMFLYYIEKSK